MSCELSYKNNLSRTEETELGNRGETSWKRARFVKKGCPQCDSPAAAGNKWKFGWLIWYLCFE